MLKIEITDPHSLPKETLIDTANFLLKIAGYFPITMNPFNTNTGTSEIVQEPSTFDEGKPFLPDYVPPPPPIHPACQLSDPVPNAPKPPKNAVDLDSNGLPWDGRIHSRTKSKTDKGMWKLQRGIDTKVVDKVSKELASVMSLPKAEGIDIISETYEAPVAPVTKNAVPQPPITQPSEDPIEPEKDTWPMLMQKITALIAAKKLTREQVNEAVTSAGIPSLHLVGTRPDLVPQISSYIDLLVS